MPTEWWVSGYQIKQDTDALSKPHCHLVFHSDIGTRMCLNEYYFILLLGGAFAGFSYSLLGVVHNMNYVSFSTVQVCSGAFILPSLKSLSSLSLQYLMFWPVFMFRIVVLPQQYKYFHVKGSVLVVLRGSATLALFTVRNFTVLYLFLGKWFLFGKFDSFLPLINRLLWSVFYSPRGSTMIKCCIVKFPGHIPKAWLCKTWNLHSNRSVQVLFIQSELFGGLSLNSLKWFSCIVSCAPISSPIHSIDSITGLLDLFYHLWLSTTFLLFTWHFTLLLFRIFVTEVYVV